MFALLEIDLSKAQSNPKDTLASIVSQLAAHGGLDYIPRERTPQGRLFEHASDSRVLLKLLQQIKVAPGDGPGQKRSSTEVASPALYIKLAEGGSPSSQSSSPSKMSTSESIDSDSLAGDDNALFTLNRDLIQLTLRANGKADLYFHAYFWQTFAQALFKRDNPAGDYDAEVVKTSVELQRLKGLAEFLKKVHANISKHLFNEGSYQRYVSEFGGRKQVR